MAMSKKFLAFVLVAAVILTGLVPAIALATGSEDNATEKTLRLAGDDYGYPNPYTMIPRGPGYTRMSMLFDTLVWTGKDGFMPMLAKKWEHPNPTTWTFTLQEGVKWHDGKPFTADDVVFTFDYIKTHPSFWFSVDVIQSVKKVDDRTVEIVLVKPFAAFLKQIAVSIPILPQHIWKDIKDPAKDMSEKTVIGTGPFTLEEYNKEHGSYIFKANKDYFLGKPVVDRVVTEKKSELLVALQSHDVDGGSPTIEEVEILEKNKDFRVIENKGFWVFRVYFNTKANPLFAKKEFRQALYTAINREEIVKLSQHGGAAEGLPGFFSTDSDWYVKTKDYDYDPEKAKSMLDALGLTDKNGDGIREDAAGNALAFSFHLSQDAASDAKLVKQYFEAVGIKIDLKAVDMQTLDSVMSQGKFQLAINGHGGLGGDPMFIVRNFVPAKPGQKATAMNFNNWSNPEYNKLFQAQSGEQDDAKRHEIVGKMQQIIADELPTLPLYYRSIYFAYDPNKLDGWYYTNGGVGSGIPTEMNKMIFVEGKWGGVDSASNDQESSAEGDNAAKSSSGLPVAAGIAGLIAAGIVAFVLVAKKKK
jgi:peptide/nickel transport system substrate-binding protein